MLPGKKLRLRRLFSRGRALVVPIDHGMTLGPVQGLEDAPGIVRTIASGPADGLLVSAGLVQHVVGELGTLFVAVRIDGAGTALGPPVDTLLPVTRVPTLVKMGADACCSFTLVGHSGEARSLQALGEIATQCCEWGLPLIAEILPYSVMEYHLRGETVGRSGNVAAESNAAAHDSLGTVPSRDCIKQADIKVACRVAAEYGADVVKTHYTGTVEGFREVVRTCPVPILVAGGPKTQTPEDFLHMVGEALQAGAAGVCMGRNVWQHPEPSRMMAVLGAMVHDGDSAGEASRLLGRV